jgi:hypothetical protein
MLGNNKKNIGFDSDLYTNKSDAPISFAFNGYFSCESETITVYANTPVLNVGNFLYLDALLTVSAGSILINLTPLPCEYVFTGIGTNIDGSIYSTNVEIGGCC